MAIKFIIPAVCAMLVCCWGHQGNRNHVSVSELANQVEENTAAIAVLFGDDMSDTFDTGDDSDLRRLRPHYSKGKKKKTQYHYSKSEVGEPSQCKPGLTDFIDEVQNKFLDGLKDAETNADCEDLADEMITLYTKYAVLFGPYEFLEGRTEIRNDYKDKCVDAIAACLNDVTNWTTEDVEEKCQIGSDPAGSWFWTIQKVTGKIGSTVVYSQTTFDSGYAVKDKYTKAWQVQTGHNSFAPGGEPDIYPDLCEF